MEDSIILQMRDITKVFPGVRALDILSAAKTARVNPP